MKEDYGRVIVYNTLQVLLFGNRYWLLLIKQEGGFTPLYKGTNIGKEEYSIIQNETSANILNKLMEKWDIEQIDICGLAGDICVLNTAKDLKEVIGNIKLNVLEAYSPSLDGGTALSEFIRN